MQRTIELNSPQHAAHSEQLVAPDTKKASLDAEFWDIVVDQFDESAEQELMLDMLLERPGEAFRTEATNFAATYYADRAIRNSNESLTFFTRDRNSLMLDSVTTIINKDDETIVRHVMSAPITYGYDNPVEIIASSSGEFHVYESVYEKNMSTMREVTGTLLARNIMEEYFNSSIRAAKAVKGRDEEARAIADSDARQRYYRSQGQRQLSGL